jgi:hypothetical protein
VASYPLRIHKICRCNEISLNRCSNNRLYLWFARDDNVIRSVIVTASEPHAQAVAVPMQPVNVSDLALVPGCPFLSSATE